MRKLIAIVTIGILSLSFGIPGYTSDWDTFGKVMAGITGLRVISGGRVDVVGGIFGINSGNRYYYRYRPRSYPYYRYYPRRYGYYYRYRIPSRFYYYRYRVPTYRVIIKERDRRRHYRHHKRHHRKHKNKGRRDKDIHRHRRR